MGWDRRLMMAGVWCFFGLFSNLFLHWIFKKQLPPHPCLPNQITFHNPIKCATNCLKTPLLVYQNGIGKVEGNFFYTILAVIKVLKDHSKYSKESHGAWRKPSGWRNYRVTELCQSYMGILWKLRRLIQLFNQ